MKISKNENGLILSDGKKTIEEYSLNKEINFSKLMTFLLGKNMNKELDFDICEDEYDEKEMAIIEIIKKVVEKYNSGVREVKNFNMENI